MATRHNRDNQAGSRDHLNAAKRFIRAYAAAARKEIDHRGERREGIDGERLSMLVELQREVDAVMAEVVTAMRSEAGGSASWQEIARACGITRQAAMKRWAASDPDTARKRGAQPGSLR